MIQKVPNMILKRKMNSLTLILSIIIDKISMILLNRIPTQTKLVPLRKIKKNSNNKFKLNKINKAMDMNHIL